MYYGIKGNVLNWIRSYLSDRTQHVKIKYTMSEERNVDCGVPQGSIMGPLLFTLYIAPLADIISKYRFDFHFYADDSQIYFNFDPSDEQNLSLLLARLDDCICDVNQWMTDNYLKMNNDKTDVILLGSSYQLENVKLTNIKLSSSATKISFSVRNLGAKMDNTLSMENHVNALCKNCYFQIRKIWRIRKSLDISATKTIVQAAVISRLDLLNVLLIRLPTKYIDKLQKVQNAAARLIYKLPKRSHVTPLLETLHWLPIQARIEFKLHVLTFKCLNGMAPEYLSELLKSYRPQRDNLRSSSQDLLEEIKVNSTYGQRAFMYIAPKLWNRLPLYIRHSSTLALFKKNLKTLLFTKTFHLD
jgi:hypothetical protein